MWSRPIPDLPRFQFGLRQIYRGYFFFFSVKDRNLFHRVDTIGNIFTSSAATSENITDGVHEPRWCSRATSENITDGVHEMK